MRTSECHYLLCYSEELLAIAHCVKNLKRYVYGHTFLKLIMEYYNGNTCPVTLHLHLLM